MPFAISIILIIVASFFALNISITEDVRKDNMKTGSFSQADHNLSNYHKYTELGDTQGYETSADSLKEELEAVETVLIRTCRTIHTLNLDNDCANPYREGNNWGFIGNVGTSGSLLTAWNGSAGYTFSCAGRNAYGRMLVQKAIPKSLIQQYQFRYDFSTMINSDATDPCGYVDIVER